MCHWKHGTIFILKPDLFLDLAQCQYTEWQNVTIVCVCVCVCGLVTLRNTIIFYWNLEPQVSKNHDQLCSQQEYLLDV